MLSVEHVCFNYGEKRILKDISFQVKKGEIVLMVGESGSGKSTLVRSIMGLVGDQGQLIKGQINLDNQRLDQLKPKQWRQIRGKQIALIFQQPERSLDPTVKLKDQFYEAILLHQKMNRQEADVKICKLLENLGFEDPSFILQQYPFQLSGGMCQRAAIALSVIHEPAFLLADEPTSALDVVVQKQTLDLLLKLKDTFHMGMLIVTHNMGVVHYLADYVGVMHRGHLVEWGKKDEILYDPKHDYTQALIHAIPKLNGELPYYERVKHSRPKKYQVWYSDTHWALSESPDDICS